MKKDRQYNYHKIPKMQSEAVNEERQTLQLPQDTKDAIRSCKLKKDRQHNGQKKKDMQ